MTVYSPVSAVPAAPSNQGIDTGTITATGVAQEATSGATTRCRLIFSNHGANLMVIGFSTSAISMVRGIPVKPGEYWDSGAGPIRGKALQVIGTIGDAFSVTEFFIPLADSL